MVNVTNTNNMSARDLTELVQHGGERPAIFADIHFHEWKNERKGVLNPFERKVISGQQPTKGWNIGW